MLQFMMTDNGPTRAWHASLTILVDRQSLAVDVFIFIDTIIFDS